MSSIKRHDGENWNVVASSDASGISTNKFIKDEETKISVEQALDRIDKKFKTHDAYIAWLTKYGGGGSGSGGGTTITEATAILTVKGSGDYVETNNEVVASSTININLKVTSVAATKTWAITIRIGSSQVATGSLSSTNPMMTIDMSKLSSYLTNHIGEMVIVASYSDDTNGVYGSATWTGTLIESTVELSVNNTSVSLSEITSANIIVDYSVGYLGDISNNNYNLLINVYAEDKTTIVGTYTKNLQITTTSNSSYSIQVSNLLQNTDDLNPGVYYLVTTMQYINNSSIFKTVDSSLTLSTSEIFIASTTMVECSEDESNVKYIEVAENGAIPMSFTAYIDGFEVYEYSIYIDDSLVVTKAGYFEQEENVNITCTSDKSWFEIDKIVRVKLVVSISSDKTATKIYGVKIVSSNNTLLKDDTTLQSHLLSQMIALNTTEAYTQFTNTNYVTNNTSSPLKSQFDSINTNSLSVITQVNSKDTNNKSTGDDGLRYLRLSNGASAYLHDWEYTQTINDGEVTTFKYGFNKLINRYTQKEFTICISFKADYHADDDRTVLFCGTTELDTGKMTYGISIDVHNIYINGKSVYTLSDNTINDVIIVCQQLNKSSTNKTQIWLVKTYLDGVLTSIEQLDQMMTLGDEIYLGCRHQIQDSKDEYYNLCDVDIYSFEIYDYAINDYDIMIKQINNKVRSTYEDGAPKYSLITQELANNFCIRNNDEIVSSMYKNGEYTINFLLDANNKIDTTNSQVNSLGIPIMMINVSNNSSWTFNAFVAQQSYGNETLSSTEGIIQYYDPNGTSNEAVEFTAEIALQGHSTLQDAIKNINITLSDTEGSKVIFIPKSTWYPEQTYTLKADVVDSSHSNNASIGKFINDNFGYVPEIDDETGEETGNGSSFLPFAKEAIDAVYNSDYRKNQQSTVTLKHTVEGFPVFLIMQFYVNSDEGSTISISPLGIYSFNLGREAYRNLGYKKVNSITINNVKEKIVSFPFLAVEKEGYSISIDETDTHGNWIEIGNTNSVNNISDLVDSLPDNFDPSAGDFWQNDKTILDEKFEVRWPTGKSITDFKNFTGLLENVMRLPIEGCETTSISGVTTIPEISEPYTTYKYGLLNGAETYIPIGTCTPSKDSNAFDLNNFYMEPDSFYKYFNIALMFGLEDNFGKNSTYRSWGIDSNGNYIGKYYMGFYDLDSGNGNSNQGELTIEPQMWLKYIYNRVSGNNNFGYAAETFNSTLATNAGYSSIESKISANTNKLWLSLDTPTFRSIFHVSDISKSLYSTYWFELRQKLETLASKAGYPQEITKAGSISFVEWYINEYFAKQTGNCGSLIFNYDYKLKYLLKFTGNSFDADKAKNLSKLHGRKISYTRDWLTKHIRFLDSLYAWRDTSQTININNDINTQGSNKVLNTPEEFSITTNTPLLVYNAIGDNVKTYYFCLQNKETIVNAGNNQTNSVLTWSISNSPNIIKFGNDSETLSSMNIQLMNFTNNQKSLTSCGYPALTDLNLSNNSAFSSSFTMDAFKQSDVSELRVIDFSNTSGSGKFNLSLTDSEGNTKFSKLTKINISGSSCISSITIPKVPLQELNITNSSIVSLNLDSQPYLTNVDITGCNIINDITITNCLKYDKVDISNLKQLTTLSITNNPTIPSIKVTGCQQLSTVNIEQNTSLTSVSITDCNSLTTVTINGSNIKTIDLSGCQKLSNLRIVNYNNVISLDLSSTSVTNLTGSTDDVIIDLSNFDNLTSFNISNNDKIQFIKFKNVKGSPFQINKPFTNCISLERIYGNVLINTTSTFYGCSKFSLFGTDLTTVTYNGKSVLDSDSTKQVYERRVKMPYEIDGYSSPSNYTYSFNDGDEASNFDMGVTNCSQMFFGTNVTTFDIYYILGKCNNVTNLSQMFRSIKDNPFYWTSVVDNSPNRYMFYNCNNVTSINYMFQGIPTSDATNKPLYFRVFSPTMGTNDSDEEIVTNDNGLFSPLTNLSSNPDNMPLYGWCSHTFVIDRFCFRHSSKTFMMNFTSFGPRAIVSNINTQSYFDTTDASLKSKLDAGELGDFTNFFNNISCYVFYNSLNPYYIDYNTLTNIPCSNQGGIIHNAFNCTYGTGTFNNSEKKFADRFFVTGVVNRLVELSSAFKVSEQYSYSKYVNLEITEDMFDDFTSLKILGYNTSPNYGEGSSSMDDVYKSSFCGKGIVKSFDSNLSEFPYNIVSKCTQLTSFCGFFSNCSGSFTTTPQLPGTLFSQNPNLTSVAGLFWNVKFDYKLSGEGFSSCTKLQNVNYLFRASDQQGYLQGHIPYKMFYHGESKKSKTFYGLNGVINKMGTENVIIDGNTVVKQITYIILDSDLINANNIDATTIKSWSSSDTSIFKVDESSTTLSITPMGLGTAKLICTLNNDSTSEFNINTYELENIGGTIKWYNYEGTEISPLYKSETFSFISPNTSITSMRYCFAGNNIEAYQLESGETPDIENNENYSPYKISYSGGALVVNSQNLLKRTMIWEYDGNTMPNDTSLDIENLDDTHIDYSPDIYCVSLGSNISGTLYFCCAPDLFRYCSANINTDIKYIFANCGNLYPSNTYGNTWSVSTNGNYGLHGRIPPYLLRPFKNVSIDISGMFYDCKTLSSYYTDTSTAYTIPKTFFDNCPKVSSIYKTFSGVSFPFEVNLQVFSKCTSLSNISYAFERLYIQNTDSKNIKTLTNIFTSQKNITNMTFAFAATYNAQNDTPKAISQYIVFTNIFPSDKYNTNTYSNLSNYSKVFAYWSSSTVSFSTKTLCDNNTTLNYKFYGS